MIPSAIWFSGRTVPETSLSSWSSIDPKGQR
ncbi:MAG: hypothetical protein QOG34_1159 [Frankiaceae bacterium]|nr:hypothetical protein [Frankiaceae bacterium]